MFDGEFEVIQCRIVGERHLKLVLRTRTATAWSTASPSSSTNPDTWLGCQRLRAAYRLDVNEFRDNRTVQLRIEYMETCPA